MKQCSSSVHHAVIELVLLCSLGSTLFCGCRKSSPEIDFAIGACRHMLKQGLPLQSKERAKQTLSKWENGFVDPKPVLIDALLITPKGEKKPVLLLAISDEDQDLLGIGIRERYLEPNGSAGDIIEETYPVYSSDPPPVVSHQIVPITIRTTAQRKDRELWKQYVEAGGLSEEGLPPLWVSVPDPNRVDVWVWLYDRQGHKSEPVQLRYLTPPGGA